MRASSPDHSTAFRRQVGQSQRGLRLHGFYRLDGARPRLRRGCQQFEPVIKFLAAAVVAGDRCLLGAGRRVGRTADANVEVIEVAPIGADFREPGAIGATGFTQRFLDGGMNQHTFDLRIGGGAADDIHLTLTPDLRIDREVV